MSLGGGSANPVQQAAVIINGKIGIHSFTARERNYELGNTLYAAPVREEVEGAQSWEIAIASNDRSDASRSGFDSETPVVTNYNGWYVSNPLDEEGSLKELRRQTRVIGVTPQIVPFNKKLSYSDAVAIQIGGQVQVFNTGTENIEPGNVVIVEPPNKDLSNCAQLPATAGPTFDKKLRPVTKPLTTDVFVETRAQIKNRFKINGEHVYDVASGQVTKGATKADVALWKGLTAIGAVGLGLAGYIEEELLKPFEAFLKVHADQTGMILFEINEAVSVVVGRYVNYHALRCMLFGCPWVDNLKTVTVRGIVVDLELIRKNIINEFTRRLAEPDAAFGAQETVLSFTGNNLFGLKIEPNATFSTKERVWDKQYSNSCVRLAAATTAVENIPELLSFKVVEESHRLAQRTLGVAISGATPGQKFDVHLHPPNIRLA